MADSEVRISKGVSYATKALGYSELRPNQELAVKHFLRGHDVFVSLACPQEAAKVFATAFFSRPFTFSMAEDREHPVHSCSGQSPILSTISEAYVVRMGTSGRDDALKGCLRLPVLQSEAA